jgi:hypothetical protein
MSGNTLRPTANPKNKDERIVEQRTIKEYWSLGEPDADGWQWKACLRVQYFTSREYTAVLSAVHVQNSDGGSVEVSRPLTDPSVLISTRAASRFSRPTFIAFYKAALEELRERFDRGDTEVIAFFDPTTEAFAD